MTRAPNGRLGAGPLTGLFLLGLTALCALVGYFVLGGFGLVLGLLAVLMLVGLTAGLPPELAMRKIVSSISAGSSHSPESTT